MDLLIPLIFALIVLVGLFWVFRAIVLWYFQIDEILKNLQEINAKLGQAKTSQPDPTE